MTYFRDHADALRVIGATFAGHALFDQPCQSWMVRRVMVPETGEPLPPTTTDIITSSAYHFVVTWIPGRALIVTGDLGAAIYSGITHLASLDDTVRLVREADFDYLVSKSTHTREFDFHATAKEMVARAYDRLRRQDDDSDIQAIIDWSRDADVTNGLPQARKTACRDLLSSNMSEHDVWEEFGDIDPPVCMSWPAQAHWHYEALRTWGDLMARARNVARVRAVRDAAMEHAAILAEIKP